MEVDDEATNYRTILGLTDDVIKALAFCGKAEPDGMLMAICTNNFSGIKLIKAY